MKKSQSQIIGAVLLILLVISLIVILMTYLQPWIIGILGQGDCFEVTNKIQISDNVKYTCYNDSGTGTLNVQIHLGNADVKGFKIELGGASSKTYEITQGENVKVTGVTMLNGSEVIYIPSKDESRTYTIDSAEKPDSLKVYPILKNGRICPSTDSLENVEYCIKI
jgi:flagellin-like protein